MIRFILHALIYTPGGGLHNSLPPRSARQLAAPIGPISHLSDGLLGGMGILDFCSGENGVLDVPGVLMRLAGFTGRQTTKRYGNN